MTAARLLLLLGAPLTALVLAVRLQLAVLRVEPSADLAAWSAGWLGAGLVLAVAVGLGLRLRSPRAWLAATAGLCVASAAVGGLALTQVPTAHLKEAHLQREWRSLHPALRSAVWIAQAADPKLTITDLSRARADYGRMGLPRQSTSAHYAPVGGYAEAIDVRVLGDDEVRRWARQGLFLALGLRAERHLGTADHLHISLPDAGASSAVAATLPPSPH